MHERPYEINSGDSLAFVNLPGTRAPRDPGQGPLQTLLGLRQRPEAALEGEGQTGHYPYPFDIDGDGRDRSPSATRSGTTREADLWSTTTTEGPRRRRRGGQFRRDPKAAPRVYACGSDEGFLLFDIEGKILKHERIGHAQSPSSASTGRTCRVCSR